jgi:hypothetical protein
MDTDKQNLIHHIVDKMVELMSEENRITYIRNSYSSTLYRRSDEVLMYMNKITDELLDQRAKFRMCGIELKFDFRGDINEFIIELTDVINMNNSQFVLNLGTLLCGNITLESSPVIGQDTLISRNNSTVLYDLRYLNMKKQYTTALTHICDNLLLYQARKKQYPYIFDANTLNNMIQAFKERYEDGKVPSKRKELLNSDWKREGLKILRALIQLLIFKDEELGVDRKIIDLDYKMRNHVENLETIRDRYNSIYTISNNEIIMKHMFKVLESDKVVKNQRDVLLKEIRKAHYGKS